MSLQEKIISLIDNPTDVPQKEWVEEMSERYPYFSMPASMLLKRSSELTDEERKTLMAKVALCSGDKNTITQLMDKDAEKWIGFYPKEEKPVINTNTAIDTFIATYGNPDPHEEEILTKLIFNPTPDYAQLLSEEEERSIPDLSEPGDDSQDAKINAFILKSKEIQGHFPSSVEQEKQEPEPVPVDDAPVNAPEATDDSLLSESLAKIYIKQHKYSKAYEIISNLSLNFPEKSIYFADQLRFLRKLIINQRHN